MILLHEAVLFWLLLAVCMRNQKRIPFGSYLSRLKIRPDCDERNSLMRIEKMISDYSSSFIVPTTSRSTRVTSKPATPFSSPIEPITLKSIEVTSKSPMSLLDFDYMLGDDPSAYFKDEAPSRSTPEGSSDASKKDFPKGTILVLNRFGDVKSPDKTSNVSTISPSDHEHDGSPETEAPESSVYVYIPPKKTKNPASNYSSSSTETTTLTSIKLTTESPIPFFDELPMVADSQSTRYKSDLPNRSTTEDSTDFFLSEFYGIKSVDSEPQSLSNETFAEKAINDAFHNFVMNYSTIIFNNNSNVVTYPISIADLMFLSSYGACFCTQETIDTMFNLSHTIRHDLEKIQLFMNKHLIGTDEILADQRMFITNNVKLTERFLRIAQGVFNSNLQQINFDRREEAGAVINNWSANRTYNVITEVVNADQFNNETEMVLVSVALINCSWIKPFDPNRSELMEFLINETDRRVWMMNSEIQCRHGILTKLSNSTFVELFLAKTSVGNPMRMIIILPPEKTSLTKIVPELLNFQLEDLNVNADENALVNISLPKFKIKTTVNLKNYQKAMGIDNIFSDIANFKLITKSRHLKVNDFIQTSVIDVNEGNHHHETTSLQINKVNSSEIRRNFHVNRPFIILIANNDTIFATAQVVDPTS